VDSGYGKEFHPAQAARNKRERKEKTMGNKVKLIVSCPGTRPFWAFASNFSQKWNKSHDEHFERIPLDDKEDKKRGARMIQPSSPSTLCTYLVNHGSSTARTAT
jgi:hypothetical protein